MPFPTVGTPVTTSLTTANTSQVITLPAVIDPGDILLVFVRVAVAGAIAWPDASWHELFDGSDDAEDDQQAAAWKLAIGNEDSITITLTSGSGKGAAIAWAIKGANPDIRPPELGTVTIGAGGTSASLDPTAVTPTGGAKDYLFGILSGGGGEPTGVTSYPTGYTIGQATVNSGAAAAATTNCQVAGAFRQLNASTQDPGGIVYTGTTAGWTAYAIAFHPGPAVADAVTLSDSATVAIAVVPPRLISGLTPESLSLLDSVTVQRWVYVPDVTVQIVTGAAGALSISGLTDVVTAVEGPLSVIETPLRLTVSDQTTVVEGVPVVLVPSLVRLINLSGSPDAVTLTESVTVQRWVYVPDVTVVIQAPSTLLTISGIADNLTVAEGPLVVRERTLVLQATDTLTLVDAGVDVDATRGVLITEGPITVVIVTAVVSLTINLSGSPDLLVVADPLVLVQERQLLLSTADLVTLVDAGSVVRETPLILTATDLFSTVDASASVLESPLIATASDLLTVVDASASARTSSLLVTTTDALSTTDAGALVQLVQGLSLSVTDSVTLAEGLLTLQLSRLLLTVSDVVSIAESAPVVVLPVLALTAADTLQVVDTVSVRLPVLNVLASDTTLVVDAGASAQLVQILRPSVSDTVTTVDTGPTVRLPMLLVSVSDSTTLVDVSSLVRLSKLLILASDSLTLVDGGADIFRPVLFMSFAADVISLGEFILVQRGSVLITIPHVSVLAEHRDFTKVSEVLISAVSAEHRDFLKIAEPRMTSVVAEHRDFTKVSEVSVVQVIAEHRDFTKVA